MEYNVSTPRESSLLTRWNLKKCTPCSAKWHMNGYLECLGEIPGRAAVAIKPYVVEGIQITWESTASGANYRLAEWHGK